MGATGEQLDEDSSLWWRMGGSEPIHEVTLSDFFIGKFEVTQALWEEVMGENPSYYAKGPNYPVNFVSRHQCQEFTEKLNALTGKTFRLPTEAEWEYAARGGKNSKKFRYSGSHDINAVAWYEENCDEIQPVGTKAPNELGIHDMSGNIYEWCLDDWDEYDSAHVTDPLVDVYKGDGILRGGSYYHSELNARVSDRRYDDPRYKSNIYHVYGLRLVLECETKND